MNAMGLFKRIGRKVEQFKQTATETATQNTNYQCEACGARLYSQHEQCPECGAESIVSISPEE
jgi:rubrerythrin